MVEMGVPEPEEAEESVQVEVSGADRIAEPEQQMGNHSEQEEAGADIAQRYGAIFKSHILGYPCVMIASPEATRQVLVTNAHLFKPTFPASKERMLGKKAIFFSTGDYHAKLRKLVLRAFTPEAIKNIVSDIESIAVDTLRSLDGNLITTFQEMKTYAFNVALLSILGTEEAKYREDLKRCYYIIEKGYNSMPINLPGTLFHKAMKARKELSRILAKILSVRRGTKEQYTDLLGSFMEESEGLTDEQIADNIIGVIFAARDTTASIITWIFKYLAENPSVLQAVTEEQEAIIKAKEESGYLIPKGWKVLPLFRNIHHNPENFPEPEKFDPSRFEAPVKPNTFIPFGSGVHSCPGNELAKLEILVLLHHLTTKYRYSMMAPQNGVQYGPFPLPQNGLPIKISLKK
ncbi:hypothetical protein SASPL_127799 [Salvia splendens]|uniref:Uncharacterized protein n=1 Tax=Salvia splendens TaxID=180675 RepID=A0A8X8ZLH9_SALSN|nr:hypothetical protein SASPL_127799 [Salvia splendens]